MKHKPFEDWIFFGDSQDSGQESELKNHLQSCDSCYRLQSDLHSVDNLFQTTPPVAPAPGFPIRWLNYHEQQSPNFNRLESVYLLIVSGGVASFIFIMILFLNFHQIRSFPDVFWEWLARAVEWITMVGFIDGMLLKLLISIPRLMIFPLWMTFFGLIGAGGLLWLVSLKKLAYYQGYAR